MRTSSKCVIFELNFDFFNLNFLTQIVNKLFNLARFIQPFFIVYTNVFIQNYLLFTSKSNVLIVPVNSLQLFLSCD